MKKTTSNEPTTEDIGPVTSGSDLLEQFEVLRGKLRKEKAELIARVARIEELLGEAAKENGAPTDGKGKLKNAMTLRQAVMQVTHTKPLTKNEIYSAVQALGYRFGSSNPWNSLNVILYGKKSKPQLKKQGDKFYSGDNADSSNPKL